MFRSMERSWCKARVHRLGTGHGESRCAVQRGAVGEIRRDGQPIRGAQRLVGEQEEIRVDRGTGVREDLQRDPEPRRVHGDQQWHAVACLLMPLQRERRVVFRGHEDGAGRRVAEQVGLDLRRNQEPVVRAPVDDRLATALEDGDVERLDLHLLDDDAAARSARRVRRRGELQHGRRREFPLQSLQRPGARLGDRRRDRGKRHDPSHVADRAGVGEAGDVVLDAAGPRDECGRLGEPHVAVGRDQPSAGERLPGLQDDRGGNTHAGEQELAHLRVLQTGSHRADDGDARNRRGVPDPHRVARN